MFCSFGKSPRICRFFCKGRVVEWDDPAFEEWVGKVGKVSGVKGVRAVIVLDVWKVGIFSDVDAAADISSFTLDNSLLSVVD